MFFTQDLVCLDISGCISLTTEIVDALNDYTLERERREVMTFSSLVIFVLF